MRFDDLIDLEQVDERRWRFSPRHQLCTPMGALQGGAGLGAVLKVMEAITGRPTIWATAQYLTFATGTEPIDIDVVEEVGGHQTSQARGVMSRRGVEILTAHAALGTRVFEHAGAWVDMPDVPAPEDCPPVELMHGHGDDIFDIIERRLARGRDRRGLDGQRGPGELGMWFRLLDETRLATVSELAFIGDFMPMAFADAIGLPFTGSSLDNTIRTGELTRTTWILADCRIHQIANGFGYGDVHLWADDGTLLGTASQTSVVRGINSISAATKRTR